MEVWQRARQLSLAVFQTAYQAKQNKDYDLSRQMKRSAGSIMDNIAEGFGRGGKKEFIQFLYISRGSASELRSQLHRALDSNYINFEAFSSLRSKTKEIEGSLFGFIQYLKQTKDQGTKYR